MGFALLTSSIAASPQRALQRVGSESYCRTIGCQPRSWPSSDRVPQSSYRENHGQSIPQKRCGCEHYMLWLGNTGEGGNRNIFGNFMFSGRPLEAGPRLMVAVIVAWPANLDFSTPRQFWLSLSVGLGGAATARLRQARLAFASSWFFERIFLAKRSANTTGVKENLVASPRKLRP
jgi:hypothetical protein